jgi:general secretion pathway protein G
VVQRTPLFDSHTPVPPMTPRGTPSVLGVGTGYRARGFTLIELLVVVVIIGLLAGLVAPRYFGQVGKSNVNIARAQIDSLGKALDTYRLDVGAYPTSDQGLQALVVKPDGVDRWQGPYLQKQVPADPWGRPYHYKAPGDHSDYDLYSYGADGQPGGTGENVDINSWEVAPATQGKN